MIRFHADLGKEGRVTWETDAEDLVEIHGGAETRAYIESELARIVLIFIGALRSPDTEKSLEDFDATITEFARRRLKRIRELGAN